MQWGPGHPLALGSFSWPGHVDGGVGQDYGWRSGVNRPESRWQAAGPRHKLTTSSSSFWWFKRWEGRKRTCNRWKGDQKEFGMGPRGPALRKCRGNVFCLERTLFTRKEQGQGPTRVDGWALVHISWLLQIIPIHVSKTTREPNRNNNINGDKRWLLQPGPTQTSWAQRSEVLRPILNLESNFWGSQNELS